MKDKDISGVFSAVVEKERDDWITVIKAAISGVRHVLDFSRPSIVDDKSPGDRKSLTGSKGNLPAGPAPVKVSSPTKASDTLDMPRKIGPLKKKAIGGTFGMKNVKNRFFRLDGGELCYFADEDMRPSKLKGHINLRNAKIIPDPNNKLSVIIQMDDGAVLEMEAATPKLASEWIDALKITINHLIGGGKVGKKRRINLTNEGTDTGSGQVVSRTIRRSP